MASVACRTCSAMAKPVAEVPVAVEELNPLLCPGFRAASDFCSGTIWKKKLMPLRCHSPSSSLKRGACVPALYIYIRKQCCKHDLVNARV